MSNPEEPRRKLHVDLVDLETAMEETSWEVGWYLDLETGQVVAVDAETRRELERIYTEIPDAESAERNDFASALEQRPLPPWRREALLDADLAPLAALGRRLAGRAQSRNRGADVFLADPEGNYLGRTCPWRECRPGLRQSCDALHCGRRPYLHDDLATIKLAGRLVAAPPVELWPTLTVRGQIPTDLAGALAALRWE